VYGWAIFFLISAAYLGLAFALRGKGPLPGGFQFHGPLLFWRTQWGKKSIQKLARFKRFWNVIADVGIVLTYATGIAVFLLLLLGLYQYITSPQQVAQNAPAPEFLIGLPGVNPLIPLGAGVAALIIALIIHEGSHGVMAYVGGLRVKSLGVVALGVPIGAFVEPEEEDMMKATTRVKNRVFAAGPTSNLILALLAGTVMSMAFTGAMTPVNNGEGVIVGNVVPDSGAEAGGMQPGDLIVAIDGTRIAGASAYSDFMADTRAGQTLFLDVLRDGQPTQLQTTLTDRGEYYEQIGITDQAVIEGNRTKGFMGVSSLDFPIIDEIVRDPLAHPFGSLPNFLYYISYPFFIFQNGVDLFAEPWHGLYERGGVFAGLSDPAFYGAATLLYWVMWLNLMLGTFNALPAGPLDGGQMFRADLSERLMRRYRVDRSQVHIEKLEMGGMQLTSRDEDTRERLARVNHVLTRTTRTLGFFILGLILLPVFAPPIIRLFS